MSASILPELSGYISSALARTLPEAVTRKTGMHLLDTLVSIRSGAALPAGIAARRWAEANGGTPQATVLGAGLKVPVPLAALANGMAAHGDETDDSHLGGRFHPGCGIVPAALAVAEETGASGMELLKAIALGYDIGARVVPALGMRAPDESKFSSHSLGTLFGATAAAAALYRLSPAEVGEAFSYACQQASGIPFWERDSEHVEKAFDFGGMGARNGVTAAAFVRAGFRATDDPFAGRTNFFASFGDDPHPDRLVDGLGSRYEILSASIKKWTVGSPIQSMIDGAVALYDEGLRPADIRRLTIVMPDDRMHIVNNRDMPAVCAQFLVAVTLTRGTLTFADAHDEALMKDPDIAALRARISLEGSAELTRARPARQSILEAELHDGSRRRVHTRAVRGTPDNPMSEAEVIAKARDILAPHLGTAGCEAAIHAASTIADAPDIRGLVAAFDRAA